MTPGSLIRPLALAASILVAASACSGPAATTAPSDPAGGGGGAGCPTAQPAPLPAGTARTVIIDTDLGRIVIATQADLSPIAVANFVTLAECGFYDGVVFHRTARLEDGTPFVIQGGDPSGRGTGGPGYTIQDEPVTTAYARGTVAMARSSQPNSVGSQFFIVLDDAAAGVLSSYNTYQIIGSVESGMEVADAILAAADGELPTQPVVMVDVSVSAP